MIMGKRSINTKTEKYGLPLPLPALVQNINSVVPINDIIYNIILPKYECISIEKNTKNQSVNPVWHDQRRGKRTFLLASYPRFSVGYGFSSVDLPSTKCTEQTLEHFLGDQSLTPDDDERLINCIHFLSVKWFLHPGREIK